MNKSSAAKNDRLLADTFYDTWTAGSAAGFARAAAVHARQRRRRRRVLAGAASLALIVTMGLALRSGHAPSATPAAVAPHASSAAAVPAPPVPARGYEIISDEELLAQLADRTLLVVQRPNGTRDIVLLDAAATPAAPDTLEE